MPGFVYLAQVSDGLYKIGQSRSPHSRVKSQGFKLLYFIESKDALKLERSIHFIFDEFHKYKEIFALTPEAIERFKMFSDDDIVDQEQAIAKGVSLYPRDWAALDTWAEENGLSRSSASRWILRQWLTSQRNGSWPMCPACGDAANVFRKEGVWYCHSCNMAVCLAEVSS